MALSFSTLKSWLVSLGLDAQLIFEGPYVEKMPDMLLTVTLTTGIGYTAEGALDNPTFQVRTRGNPLDQDSAEKLAYRVDSLLFGVVVPYRIADTSIQLVDRVGGQPAPLGPPDAGDRYEYVCNYRLTVSTLPIGV